MFGLLDQTKEINVNGIGLGLHISKLIANQFDGDVWCKSKEGCGSEFGFFFKLKKKEEPSQ